MIDSEDDCKDVDFEELLQSEDDEEYVESEEESSSSEYDDLQSFLALQSPPRNSKQQ